MHRLAILLFVLLAATVNVSADTLTIKESFIVGWKYSFDDQKYYSALFSSGSLKAHMREDSVAVKHIDNFTFLQISSIGLLAAGVVVTVIEIKEAADNKWEVSDDLPLTIAGGVALIGSFACEHWSGVHLKKAAARYNDAHRIEPPTLSLTPEVIGHGPGIALRLRF